MLGVIAFHEFDALRLQLGAHGRIDIGVRTGHTMAQGTGQQRQSAHKRATNSQDMYVHGV